ncbi:DUF2878 domain-containing protein [Aliikangiella sp. G2MR2-5]|uniref:DUF2878 domain-containing protein n=1 Tax=Aliikangiella sp. G2MR2-5 TaxID=2788943 RepID=UPI0018AC6AA8|nr:DUF2878 domain-containing protein [Aliikangiella sp. G2MR2-5]
MFNKRFWVSMLAFDIGWGLIVFGVNDGAYWFVLPGILAYSIADFIYSERRANYFGLILGILIVGCLADFMMAKLDLIRFAGEATLPVWMSFLWLLFSVTFANNYYPLIIRKYWLVLMVGALGGPFSYFAATQLSVAQVIQPEIFYPLSSLFWATLFFVLTKVTPFNKVLFAGNTINKKGKAGLKLPAFP